MIWPVAVVHAVGKESVITEGQRHRRVAAIWYCYLSRAHDEPVRDLLTPSSPQRIRVNRLIDQLFHRSASGLL